MTYFIITMTFTELIAIRLHELFLSSSSLFSIRNFSDVKEARFHQVFDFYLMDKFLRNFGLLPKGLDGFMERQPFYSKFIPIPRRFTPDFIVVNGRRYSLGLAQPYFIKDPRSYPTIAYDIDMNTNSVFTRIVGYRSMIDPIQIFDNLIIGSNKIII